MASAPSVSPSWRSCGIVLMAEPPCGFVGEYDPVLAATANVCSRQCFVGRYAGEVRGDKNDSIAAIYLLMLVDGFDDQLNLAFFGGFAQLRGQAQPRQIDRCR